MNTRTEIEDRLVDQDLREVIGGESPPDLGEAIEGRIRRGAPIRALEAPRTRWMGYARAAVVLLALSLIGLVALSSLPSDDGDNGRPVAVSPKPENLRAMKRMFAEEVKTIQVTSSPFALEQVYDSRLISDQEQIKLVTEAATNSLKKSDVLYLLSKDWRVDFLLEDGRKIEARISSIHSDDPAIIDIRLPGWEGFVQYDVDPKFFAALKSAFEAAGPVPPLKPDDTQSITELIRSARQMHIVHRSLEHGERRVVVTNLDNVQEITGAMTVDFRQSRPPGGWDPIWDAYLVLESGWSIRTALNPDQPWMNVKLPGWERFVQYDVSPQAFQTVREAFQNAEAEVARPFRVLREWTGRDSKIGANIHEPELHYVETDAAWRELWSRHKPDETPPPVDFRQERVIAYFDTAWVYPVEREYRLEVMTGKQYVVRIAEHDLKHGTYHPTVLDAHFGIWVFPRPSFPVWVEYTRYFRNEDGTPWGLYRPKHLGTFAANRPENARAEKPSRTFTGLDTKIEGPAFIQRIEDEDQWRELWQRHAPGAPVPEVDFDTEWVTAAFFGRTMNATGVKLRDILDDGSRLTIRLDNSVDERRSAADWRTPFAIYVMPRRGLGVSGYRTARYEVFNRFITRDGELELRTAEDPYEYQECSPLYANRLPGRED